MKDYKELIKALREKATFEYTGKLLSKREQALEQLAFDAADALEEILRARTDELNAAYRQGYDAAMPKRGEWYCYTCKYLDKKPLEECGYGKCRLCDMEVEAIHDWGCTDWEKMEVQE